VGTAQMTGLDRARVCVFRRGARIGTLTQEVA